MMTGKKKLLSNADYHEGIQFTRSGEHERAEESFRKALLQDPDNSEIFTNLGVALDLQFKREEAESIFREAIKRFPEYSFAWYSLGLLLGKQGRYEEAEKKESKKKEGKKRKRGRR